MAMLGILQQLAKSSPMMGKVKQMMSMVSGAQNPNAMLNQLVNSNPQMKQVMDMVNQHGGDPQKAFYAMAEQMGVNPQDVLDMLK